MARSIAQWHAFFLLGTYINFLARETLITCKVHQLGLQVHIVAAAKLYAVVSHAPDAKQAPQWAPSKAGFAAFGPLITTAGWVLGWAG